MNTITKILSYILILFFSQLSYGETTLHFSKKGDNIIIEGRFSDFGDLTKTTVTTGPKQGILIPTKGWELRRKASPQSDACSWSILIDSSDESHRAKTITKSLRIAKEFIKTLPETDNVSVYHFDYEAKDLCLNLNPQQALKQLKTISTKNLTQHNSGGTLLYAAILSAAKKLSLNKTPLKAMLIISDGKDETADNGSAKAKATLLEYLRKEKIIVHSLAYAENDRGVPYLANLKDLSEKQGGVHLPVNVKRGQYLGPFELHGIIGGTHSTGQIVIPIKDVSGLHPLTINFNSKIIIPSGKKTKEKIISRTISFTPTEVQALLTNQSTEGQNINQAAIDVLKKIKQDLSELAAISLDVQSLLPDKTTPETLQPNLKVKWDELQALRSQYSESICKQVLSLSQSDISNLENLLKDDAQNSSNGIKIEQLYREISHNLIKQAIENPQSFTKENILSIEEKYRDQIQSAIEEQSSEDMGDPWGELDDEEDAQIHERSAKSKLILYSSIGGGVLLLLIIIYFTASPRKHSNIPETYLTPTLKPATKISIHKAFVTIGRKRGNDICIPNDSISKLHCTIELDKNNTWIISDQHSSNSVFLNGQKIQKSPLKSNDIIQLGEVKFTFHTANQ